jgi:sensor histidine kinase YesM
LDGDGAKGVGLANIRERLRTLYGDEASLSLAYTASEGTVATIRLPARQSADA